MRGTFDAVSYEIADDEACYRAITVEGHILHSRVKAIDRIDCLRCVARGIELDDARGSKAPPIPGQ